MKNDFDPAEYTLDVLFEGRLVCFQPRQGYRFSLDAVILAHFIAPEPSARILDLGTGCGIIPLILAYRWPGVRCTGLELQPALAEVARRNVELKQPVGYDLKERLTMIEGDLRCIDRFMAPGLFDHVVANPPYQSKGASRINPDSSKAKARHEITADLKAIIRAAAHGVRDRGHVALIYPAGRTADLVRALKEEGLEPKRLRTVCDYPGGKDWLVLVDAVKGGNDRLEIMPHLYVRSEAGGPFSEEVARCFEG